MIKNKIFNIGNVKMKMRENGFPDGFVLKRNLNVRECRHIMKNLLGIQLNTVEDCYDREEYMEYNTELVETVNGWLVGDNDDNSIME